MKFWHYILLVSSFSYVHGIAQNHSDEEKAWIAIETFSGSNEKKITLLDNYIKKYPKGRNIERAKNWKHELQNEFQQGLVDDAIKRRDPQKLNYVLKNYPDNKRSKEIRRLIKNLEADRWKLLNMEDSTALRRYITDFPNSEHHDEIYNKLLGLEKGSSDEIATLPVTVDNLLTMNVRELQNFIRRNPQSPLVTEGNKILIRKEESYYNATLAQTDNFPEFNKLYLKFKGVFPESKRLNSLNGLYDSLSKNYRINKNKPEYQAWFQLEKGDIGAVLQYNRRYPDGPFKKQLKELIDKLENKLYKKAISGNTLNALTHYRELLPNGKHIAEINKMISELESNPKYQEYKALASTKNITKLDRFINDNKNNPLVNYARSVVNSVSDILYILTNDESGILIQLENFESPFLKVSDPDNVILIDSSELKNDGYFVVNFDDAVSNSEITIFDTNGRQRGIKFDDNLKADLVQTGNILKILIEGGVPPYSLDYKNNETNFIDWTCSNVVPGKDNFFLVNMDTVKNLTGGKYDLRVKSNFSGQMVMLSGIVVDVHSYRVLYFTLFAVALFSLIVWVIRLYLKRSRVKTIFDEIE